ncbi:unnamed protein product [Pseudo-nitzschia multistriata]|uniref:Asparagine synthetase domain-containing protein n=1 Tax=Pseudo-nitzschia multistriata TaxID=183589 RepID=A0A448ZLM8_9STRA|nr:unnamed protein product [Pseudo-nitzschia multistriata]
MHHRGHRALRPAGTRCFRGPGTAHQTSGAAAPGGFGGRSLCGQGGGGGFRGHRRPRSMEEGGTAAAAAIAASGGRCKQSGDALSFPSGLRGRGQRWRSTHRHRPSAGAPGESEEPPAVRVTRTRSAVRGDPSAALASASDASAADASRAFAAAPSSAARRPYDPRAEDLASSVDELLLRTRALMDGTDDRGDALGPRAPSAHHVVAFSGGIDSSLAAALVHETLRTSSPGAYASERATAVLGLSPAVPLEQELLAREVAAHIGIALETVRTTEGSDDLYVANDGRACLACKTHLYDNLRSIADRYLPSGASGGGSGNAHGNAHGNALTDVLLYNGTNAEDLDDPTRLGLVAASDFGVRSPLSHLSKASIRSIARHYFGLPNWDRAAAPCLRSRLAVGVLATEEHLRRVGAAEAFVKRELHPWDHRRGLRVRVLAGNRAMIEVEEQVAPPDGGGGGDGDECKDESGRGILDEIRDRLGDTGPAAPASGATRCGSPWRRHFLDELGFASVGVRPFRTGSVAPTAAQLRKHRGRERGNEPQRNPTEAMPPS